jgi:hypothetical protein
MVNYFWLSMDPEESASWYCDQHCFKIGAEVVESVWDSVLVLCPSLSLLADKEGFSKSYRKRRHSRPGTIWHPLSIWHGLCRANMRRGLINADAIFKEHHRRTGTSHTAWKECKFLMDKIDTIDFNSEAWNEWHTFQTKREWVKEAINTRCNRNICTMTEPVQCINEKLFHGCKIQGNVVEAYRRYYNAKVYSLGLMRYFYSSPPSWLYGYKQMDGTKLRVLPYMLDTDGYVIVVFRNRQS